MDNSLRILVIEDNPDLAANMIDYLTARGHVVDAAGDGQTGLRLATTGDFDVILLDLILPRLDGISLCRRLREDAGKTTPVLMLTARDSLEDKIAGLEAGADDYLVKPFDLDELAARLRALLRRRSGRATPLIENGPLTLDPASHEVRLDGAAINLSAREFGVLHALLENPGVPLSRSQIEDRLYGWEQEIGSNAVEVHIHALRRKLGSDWIRNVRGVGYMVPRQP